MSNRLDLEQALARLNSIRVDPTASGAAEILHQALAARSNIVVARAAEIIAEWELSGYAQELHAAFDRFMIDAVRRDPTCAAKIAIVEALLKLDDTDADLYARGIRHLQPEPVWGGTEDTAARLRASCALGLARANPPDVLISLADLLADPETDARTGAARALGMAGRSGASALLWYKTLAGDNEVAPLYECFVALLALEPERSPAHVGHYLTSPDPALAEAAASALGESRLAAAGPILRAVWADAGDPARRAGLLRALAMLPDEESFAFLLDLYANGNPHDAADAGAALAVYRDDRRRWRKVERAAARRKDPG